MSIPFKTEIGIVYVTMAINCREVEAKKRMMARALNISNVLPRK